MQAVFGFTATPGFSIARSIACISDFVMGDLPVGVR